MVLVDTSVWVRFFANRALFAGELDRLLEEEQVTGHEFVFGELLIGDAGGRKDFLADYQLLPWIPRVDHREVAAFVQSRKLQGKGIGWFDAHLLASALVAGVRLWTADKSLSQLAASLRIAYFPER